MLRVCLWGIRSSQCSGWTRNRTLYVLRVGAMRKPVAARERIAKRRSPDVHGNCLRVGNAGAVVQSRSINRSYRPSPEVRRQKFSRLERPVSGYNGRRWTPQVATSNSLEQTCNVQGRRNARKPELPAAVQRIEPALSVESRPEVVCQVFFAVPPIDVSSGEPRRLRALRYVDSSYGVRVCQQR